MSADATTDRSRPAQATERSHDDEAAGVQHLRAGAQLAVAGMTAAGIATIAACLLSLTFPVSFFLFAALWWFLPPAAAAGAVSAGAALAICRGLELRPPRRVWAVVLASAAALSMPAFFALAAVHGRGSLEFWWLWLAVAVLAAAAGYRNVLRHPFDGWRSIIVRLCFGVAVALASVGAGLVMSAALDHFDDGPVPRAAWLPPSLLLGVAGTLGLVAVLVSLGPFRTRTTAALTWAGFSVVILSIVAVMLGLVLQSEREDRGGPDPAASPPAQPGTAERWRDPATGYRGDAPRAEVPYPTLDEARAEFAALAESTVEAAGGEAIWRDDPAVTVQQLECGDGGTVLRIDAEFAMGIVTETTSDEHDRRVTEANLAAADRIVRAWSQLGLGTPEVVHGEPLLGGAGFASVDFAEVDFAFGVAQPRIEGRCLPRR